MDITKQIQHYILENFLYTDDESELPTDVSLFDTGVIDSTGVLDVVGFMEETFGIAVDDADLVPDNFDSVERMAAYVKRRGDQD